MPAQNKNPLITWFKSELVFTVGGELFWFWAFYRYLQEKCFTIPGAGTACGLQAVFLLVLGFFSFFIIFPLAIRKKRKNQL